MNHKQLYLVLALITISLFSISLFFYPVDGDILRSLYSVANESNPLYYFVDDMTRSDLPLYRPFFTFTLWFYYRIFGVWYLPSQLIDILIHFISSCLVLRILLKQNINPYIALLSTLIAALSVYATSPVPWGSERTLLIVNACMLLVVSIYTSQEYQKNTTKWFILLSIFALLNKESGLAIPLLILFVNLFIKKGKIFSTQNISVALIIISYTILRLIIFKDKISYSESGYLFSVIPYGSLNEFPIHLKIIAYADNIFKNIIQIFFPIFTSHGKFSLSILIRNFPLWLPTILLVYLATRKGINQSQKIFLVVIFFNALIHFAVFRYRTLYIGQFGLSLFLGYAFAKENFENFKILNFKVLYIILLLVFSHIFYASNSLRTEYDKRERILDNIDKLNNYGRITQEVKETYKYRYAATPF